jgi:predicted ATP-dependent serine protease
VATVTQAQRTRFVGRREELAAVEAALDGLRGGRARWLVVSGEPGIGKTRLLGELAERAAARRHQLFVGGAPSWSASCRSRSGSTRSTTTSPRSASASSRR